MKPLSSLLTGAVLVALASCGPVPATAPASLQAAAKIAQTTLVDGQLFCAKATVDGPLTVALVNAVDPGAIMATGATSDFVKQACAVINGIPATPPANTANTPVVAIVPPSPVAAKPT